MSKINFPAGRQPNSRLNRVSVQTSAITIADMNTGDPDQDGVLIAPWNAKDQLTHQYVALPRDPDTLLSVIKTLQSIHNKLIDESDAAYGETGRKGWVAEAQRLCGDDEGLEVDDEAMLSVTNGEGVFVQCWKWVAQEDVVPEKQGQPYNWYHATVAATEHPDASLFLVTVGVMNSDDRQVGEDIHILSCGTTEEEGKRYALNWTKQHIPLAVRMHFMVKDIERVQSEQLAEED